jgi:ferredoxin/flavodoxin---NADP+ reductase
MSTTETVQNPRDVREIAPHERQLRAQDDRSRGALLSHAAFEEPSIETSIDSDARGAIREPAPPAGARFTTEKVLTLRHWTPSLLSFRTTRAAGFRFAPGHYGRLGLDDANDGVIWRPFSVVSALHDQYLEFFATLVPGGTFSSLLARAREGDTIRMEKASYGFLTIDRFAPGKDLWLIASGTGLGPFLSILRDPDTWQIYDNFVLVHSVRHGGELAYRDEIAAIPNEELLTASSAQLKYVPVVTRERWPGALAARIPQLIEDGRLEQAAGVKLDPQCSRIMVCGNPEMARELRGQLTVRGFRINRRAEPGQLAFENYWQAAPS